MLQTSLEYKAKMLPCILQVGLQFKVLECVHDILVLLWLCLSIMFATLYYVSTEARKIS